MLGTSASRPPVVAMNDVRAETNDRSTDNAAFEKMHISQDPMAFRNTVSSPLKCSFIINKVEFNPSYFWSPGFRHTAVSSSGPDKNGHKLKFL